MQVDCIITAAGLSSRMGQWKMMLPWQGGTILDASIKNARRCCSHIILVTGFRHQELMARYSSVPNMMLVYNPDFRQGLYSSVKAGLQTLRHDYCFITHGDLPCLDDAIFYGLWEQRFEGTLMPYYAGIPGHPILTSTSNLRRCLSEEQQTSVRQSLLTGLCRQIPLNNPAIVLDIDTPEDYSRLNKGENKDLRK
ncbi:NTP transferase domain-containing protein [Enterobacter mori]|jgi:molybdenum cofactor cytidylyltransferase|uniref:NTP transferase domain-containing protein n=1 Tax=Enterobacter mori TaxID=539813 RepID=UPI003D65C17F